MNEFKIEEEKSKKESKNEEKLKRKKGEKSNYVRKNSNYEEEKAGHVIKFKDAISEFIYYKKLLVKESTLENYKYNIKHRLSPIFNELTFEELENYDYNCFSAGLVQALSIKTVRDTMILLKSILEFINQKYNTRINTKLITLPKKEKQKIQVFSVSEKRKLNKFLMSTEDAKYLGVLISLYAGLRIGEVCSLKWENIDFRKKSIAVEKTVQRMYIKDNKTKVVIGTPKTTSSNRIIPLGNAILKRLMHFKKNYYMEDYILTGRSNKVMEPSNYRNIYKNLLKELNIDYKNYHTLRHTFATRCIQIGMDAKSLSEILGHANVTTTLEIYVHSSFETKRKYLNKF